MAKDVVSIEKVLNSRCSSDSGPIKGHFGTFTGKHASDNVVDRILGCLETPRFSEGKLLHWFENGYLFLGFEDPKDQDTQRLLHVESGMQHQAVYLACAAEGMGTCIHNQGINGMQKGEKTSTARHPIMEITDPYESGKFTTKPPGPQNSMVTGKGLIEPLRDGDVECLLELSKLATSKSSGSSATEKDVSQLLWAARGRTPHCINIDHWKFMWGLTIPTWGGIQNIASVYLIKEKKLYAYVNWTKNFSLLNRFFGQKFGWTRGNPTHAIQFVRNVDIASQMNGHDEAIFLCQNEQTGRALWEIGYMLENMFLQAKSLDVSYESKIFSANEASSLGRMGVINAVAAFFI
jgi:hypothetical protein